MNMRERLSTELANKLGRSRINLPAAIGMVEDKFSQAVLGARYGEWTIDIEIIHEAATRRSWEMWQRNERDGWIDRGLNERMVSAAMWEWRMSELQRFKRTETSRAKALKVDYRRYRTFYASHLKGLVRWLDNIEERAVEALKKKILT